MKTNNINNFILKFWPQIVLILIIIIGYWQIVFFQTTFKFDAIYNHLPWRFLIVDNLRHGHLPLWNYYHHLGTPIHADPQSGAWYPIVWLFSLFGSYDLYSYNIEFILHIIIAGLGMQYLAKNLGFSKSVMLMLSVSYVFSGFFASNSMFFTWVISAAWIPFILAEFIIILRQPKLINSIKLAFFIFLLITGGYPAFTIILAYILVLGSLFYFLQQRKQNKAKLKKQIIYLFSSLFITAMLSAVLLVSVAIVTGYMTRGEPLPWDKAVIPPFLPKHLLSLVLPYAYVQLDYDQSVLFDGSNIYIGLLSFIFLLSGIIYLKKYGKKVYVILMLIALFLFLSFGAGYGFYYLSYNYLPGFKYFRFPTMIRYFALLGMLLLAGYTGNNILKNKQWKDLLWPIFITASILLLFLIISLFKTTVFQHYNQQSFYDFVIGFSFWDKVFLQSIFQLVILVIIYILVKYIKKNQTKTILLFVFLFIDLLVAFNIYMPYTITSYKADLKESNAILHENIKDFSLEANHNIYKNSTHPDSLYLYSHFLYIYQKRIGDKGNTFKLKNYKELKTKNSTTYDSLINNSVFYFVKNSSGSIQLHNFDYNSITIETNNLQEDSLVFLQNYYPGWQVKINDKSSDLLKFENNFMEIALSPGKNVITFSYEPFSVYVALVVSVLSLIGGFIFFIIKIIRKE